MKEYIKFGIGFFFGYKIAEKLNEIAGEVYVILKKRVKDGTC